jgi:hypothetical protein
MKRIYAALIIAAVLQGTFVAGATGYLGGGAIKEYFGGILYLSSMLSWLIPFGLFSQTWLFMVLVTFLIPVFAYTGPIWVFMKIASLIVAFCNRSRRADMSRADLIAFSTLVLGVIALPSYAEYRHLKNLHPHPPPPVAWFQFWVDATKSYANISVDSSIAKDVTRWLTEYRTGWVYATDGSNPRNEWILTDTYAVGLSTDAIHLDYMWSRSDYPEYPITIKRPLNPAEREFWRSAIKRMAMEAHLPKQSSDPTVGSVTLPAGAGRPPSVAVDH